MVLRYPSQRELSQAQNRHHRTPPQWSVTYALGVEPTKNEDIAALRSMANAKVVEPDELPVELLKLGPNHDLAVLWRFPPQTRHHRTPPQWPVTHAFGVEPTKNEDIAALRSMANAKAVEPDELPVGLLKLRSNHDLTVLRGFPQMIKLVWHQRKVPQTLQVVEINVLHKTKDRTECRIYPGISLVAHTDKICLKIIVTRLSAYCEVKRLLLKEQYGFGPHQSTTGMMFVVCRLQELEREACVPLFLCFIHQQKPYGCDDRTLIWQVLACVRKNNG